MCSAMPIIKNEGDSDGDDDMSGAESQHSGSSGRAPDRDSSGEDADEPDSDDSSEMDEIECERRRNDCLDNLSKGHFVSRRTNSIYFRSFFFGLQPILKSNSQFYVNNCIVNELIRLIHS